MKYIVKGRKTAEGYCYRGKCNPDCAIVCQNNCGSVCWVNNAPDDDKE